MVSRGFQPLRDLSRLIRNRSYRCLLAVLLTERLACGRLFVGRGRGARIVLIDVRNNVKRALLDFIVDAPDVFTHDAKADQLHAAKK